MKEYLKPELEYVALSTEAITSAGTQTPGGSGSWDPSDPWAD